jgi:hypothetical protein
MMSPLTRDSLDRDTNTLVFEPRRKTLRIHGHDAPSLLNRCGIQLRQWDRLEHCWMVSLREMRGLIALAERDRRTVIIEDHSEDDAPLQDGGW